MTPAIKLDENNHVVEIDYCPAAGHSNDLSTMVLVRMEDIPYDERGHAVGDDVLVYDDEKQIVKFEED